jgi:phosphatidate cytidylyltransferase
MNASPQLLQLLKGTLAVLLAATLTGQILRRTARSETARRTVANINARILAWWALCGVTALALLLGTGAVCALFAAFSLLALREFLEVARPGGGAFRKIPHLYAITVAHYALIWDSWPGVFLIVIPVGASVIIPAWNLLADRAGHTWERSAEQFCGLIITTYCLSYAPALMTLTIPEYEGRNATLLFYLLLVTQSSDIMQYVCGKLFGRHLVAPRISPNKTWEGLVGGILSATALGTALYRVTPFDPWQAAAICAAVTSTGFLGGLTMSAIKRRRGVKDYGTIVIGHGGMLDRIDSLCFAAPVFYVLVRYLV